MTRVDKLVLKKKCFRSSLFIKKKGDARRVTDGARPEFCFCRVLGPRVGRVPVDRLDRIAAVVDRGLPLV